MTTEVLNLRPALRVSSSSCATHPIAGEILQSLREMFAHADAGPEHAPLDADLEAHAAALAAASGAAAIAETGPAVIAACHAAVAAVERRQALRNDDIASLVAMVRHTVDSFATGQAASAAALGESTTRLEGMQEVADFRELKQMLAEEVVTLRRIAAARERDHERTVRALSQKLTKAEEQLGVALEEARLDPLTNAANRRAFDAVLAERVAAAHPSSTLVLALFDVDGFKGINDRFGHLAGDAVLQHVARRIRESVRQDDVVARIGGDEFALIASGLTLAQAESRARALLQRIAGEGIGDQKVSVSLSCGVSGSSAGDTMQTLIGRTDAALSGAKAQGKNRVVARKTSYIRTLLRQRR